jgi:hypothetical protein
MRLEIGDKIYCYKLIGDGLTLDKSYKVVNTRSKDSLISKVSSLLDNPLSLLGGVILVKVA